MTHLGVIVPVWCSILCWRILSHAPQFDTPAEKLRLYITKENGAVMAKDEAGSYHIITKYDVIAALGN